MKAVPIQSSDDPRSLKKVDKVYVSNKLPALFYMLLKRKRANITLQTGVSVLTPVCMADQCSVHLWRRS